ncbi:MAG: hypothetical protein E7558_00105 [Ruminococcaceae bacterium]|nr:hypothetical protein [Oscillospiraceae bacterium]
MAVDGYLNFNTKIDTKGFNLGTKNITSSIGSLKSVLGKLSAVAGVAFSVRGIVNFAKESIELASNLEEVQNVVDVAFGDMSGKMEEFADKAIEMYGISELAAKKTGSTFMSMAKGMQIPKDVASDMSIVLTGLSADMASFYNVEQDVASTALNSVFTGETETLKKYGIVMTETNLQQFAYTQGINKKISAMSQAEKVMLRYNYVMSQTALAQGDFARTSGNWANQTRVLSMQWQQFSANLGVIFKNVIKPALAYINQALSVLIAASERLVNTFSELFGWETESADATGQVSSSIADAVGNQEDLTQAVKDTAKANERALMGFDKINKLSDNSSDSSLGGSSVPIGDYSIGSTLEMDTSPAEESLSKFKEKLSSTISGFITDLALTFKDVFLDWEDVTGEDIAQKVITGLGAIVGGVAGFTIAGVPGAVVGAITGISLSLIASSVVFDHDGQINGEEILTMITTVLTGMVGGAVGFTLGGVGGAAIGITLGAGIGLLISSMTVDFDGQFEGQEIAEAIITALGMLAGGVIGFSSGGGIAGAAVGMTIGATLAMSICEMSFDTDGSLSKDEIVGLIVTALSGIAGAAIGFSLGGSMGAAFGMSLGIALSMILNQEVDWGGAPADVVGGLLQGIKDAFSNIGTWIKENIFDPFINGFKEAFGINSPAREMKPMGEYIIEGLKEGIGDIWSKLSQKFTDLLTNIKTWFTNKKAEFQTSWNNFTSVVKDKTANMKANIATKVSDFKAAWKQRSDVVKDKTAQAKISFSQKVSDIKEKAQNRYKAITEVFSGIPGWFKDKFSKAWEKVKDVFSKGGETFSAIKDGILDSLKKVINGLIDGINAVIKAPFDGINTALKKVKDIKIAGATPFKDKIKLINVPEIPKLATGTVVPANYGEFLAVLGDNKRETEVVSPLSTIKRAVAEVIGDGINSPIELIVYLDGDVVYRKVVQKNNQETKRRGVNPLAV